MVLVRIRHREPNRRGKEHKTSYATTRTESQPRRQVEDATRCLALDAVAAEIVGELRDRGVPSILLKGRSFDDWLYGDGAFRTYVDIDLLVPRADAPGVGSLLTAMGFELVPRALVPDPYTDHAKEWFRARDGIQVDLHYSLVGIDPAVDGVFAMLAGETEPMRVGGQRLDVLGPRARAMHLALHAAAHGLDDNRPLEDLARALDKLPVTTWQEAAELAAPLGATQAFAAGLRLLPEGEALAERLGLPTTRSVEVAMAASSVPYSSWFVRRLMSTPGLRGKLALLAPKLLPDADSMRVWYPLARRGRLGLLAAYLVRPLWLARHAGPAVLGWWRARREAY